ncbi:ATP-binding protein [candidate division KSB1 bacterium]|nr:ATP-binding protein [candidate division KSB1 bacterium]
MFKKYTWNFIFTVLIVAVLGFVVLDIVLYQTIRNFLFDQMWLELKMKTQLAARWLNSEKAAVTTRDSKQLHEFALQLRQMVRSRITIIAPDGTVLTDSDIAPEQIATLENHRLRKEIQAAWQHDFGQSYRYSASIKQNLFYTAVLLRDGPNSIGFLRLAYYASDFEKSLKQIRFSIMIANLIGLAVLVVLTLLFGRLVTVPILHLVHAAEKISVGNYERRFTIRTPDEIGKLARILNRVTDQLKTQLVEISTERTRLENILMNLDVGIIVVDHQFKMRHVNPEVVRILQLTATPAPESIFFEIFRSENLITAIRKTLDHGQKEQGEEVCLRDQKKIFLNYSVLPFSFSATETRGALIQLRDITEIKILEAIRRDFVANASHELKTPLTAIVGYTETLLDGAVEIPDARLKFIRRIREQAQRLEILVTDLLKLSELEREHPLEFKIHPIVPLVREVLDEFKEPAREKQIHLVFETEINPNFKIDPEAMRTVFNNLIDNAVKYTSENGKVTVRIFPTESAHIRFEVIDTGIGIDPKYHERIFQRFYRVDKARSRALGGTGLGLAIVKHIIEQHGSKIHLRSELGAGSCFWFELAVPH